MQTMSFNPRRVLGDALVSRTGSPFGSLEQFSFGFEFRFHSIVNNSKHCKCQKSNFSDGSNKLFRKFDFFSLLNSSTNLAIKVHQKIPYGNTYSCITKANGIKSNYERFGLAIYMLYYWLELLVLLSGVPYKE